MQRKSTVQTQTSIADMHFAVAPYEVQYSVPNDEIYSLYFQKGLQILGQTQYPIENHQKLKKIELPILKNVVTFRLFSDRNSEYQWSIYKRVSQMQEFLETKKINLKDTLKKQPEKKPETEKSTLQKKQANGKSKITRRDSRNMAIRGSDLRGSELISIGSQQNVGQKSGDTPSQAKGFVYSESIVSDVGKFTLKFYLFKAHSSQELSKTIQEKAKQKQQAKTAAHQNSGIMLPHQNSGIMLPHQNSGTMLPHQNSGTKLPEITERDSRNEAESNRNTLEMNEAAQPSFEYLPRESRRKDSQVEIKEAEKDIKTLAQQPIKIVEEPVEGKVIEYPKQVEEVVLEQTLEPFSDVYIVQQETEAPEAFATNETPVQTEQNPVEQPVLGSSGLKRTQSVVIQQDPAQEGVTKKGKLFGNKIKQSPSIYISIIIIVFLLLPYFNYIDITGYIPEGITSAFNSTSSTSSPKKAKKQRFSNRKKPSDN